MVRRLIITFAFAISGVAISSTPAHAQGRPMHFSGGQRGMTIHFGPRGGTARGARGFRGARPGRFARGRYVAYPYPYFWPDEGYGETSAPPPEPPAQIVVVPPPAAPAAPPAPPPPSLTMEYRDGHWVRVPTGDEMPTSVATERRASAASSAARDAQALEEETAKPAPQLPHAILVFRDGRKLKLQRYEIRNGFIYASGDYWDTSSPTRKIAISELNVPATLRLNRQLGSKFSLPSNPDEVVVSF
jgi:hypothetical protein